MTTRRMLHSALNINQKKRLSNHNNRLLRVLQFQLRAMKSFLGISLLLMHTGSSSAFTNVCFPGVLSRTASSSSSSSAIFAIDVEDIEDVGYYTSVQKPLGVVFGENAEPYSGLRVDDIEMGSQGMSSGLRVGDQLLAVNGQVMIGGSFDACMGVLQASPAKMKLLMFRGNVRDLYTIIDNRNLDNDDDDGGGSEAVIMDENYESPVRIEVKEPEKLDLMKVFNKLTAKRDPPETPAPKLEAKKSGGGLFGMFGESIQLDGDEASGTGR